MRLRISAFGLLCGLSCHASALTFTEAYQQALLNDPDYRIEQDQHGIDHQQVKVARAVLLPTVNLTYQKYDSKSDIVNISEYAEIESENTQRGDTTALVVSQPIFDYQRYAHYKSSTHTARAADESLESKRQELAVRLFEAYSTAMVNQQKIELAQAQIKAYSEQLHLNRRLMDEGEGTITDVLETDSLLSLAQAEEIDATNNLDDAIERLAMILGRRVDVHELHAFHLQPLLDKGCEQTFDGWQQRMVRDNPELAARRQEMTVSEYAVKSRRAGHYPRVTAYAQAVESTARTNTFFDRDTDTTSVGVQISLPLFSGGSVTAGTRQERMRLDMRQRELDKRLQELRVDLRQQFNTCTSSLSKIRAYQQAVNSAETLVQATRLSVVGGERINLDVLTAEQTLYSAKQRLITAQHDYLLSRFRLLYHAGAISQETLAGLLISKY